jgi:hypothetical protein
MTNPFFCLSFGGKLDSYSYRNAKFCSNKCRTKYCRVMKEFRERDPKKWVEDVTNDEGL